MPASWKPLLTGSAAAKARRAVASIAGELARRAPGPDPSLGSGAAGIALMFGALAEPRADALESWIGEAAGSEDFHVTGLHSGYAGLGLAVELLARRGFVSDDVNEEIDTLIGTAVDDWSGEADLLAGITGLGVYALARAEHAGMTEAVRRVVRHLRETAVRDEGGAAWWTPFELLPSGHRPKFPDGYANLGMAHGQPGMIAFLAQACAFDESARPLLTDAVRWLLARRLPHGGLGQWDAPGYEPTPARLAWCYGDPGVAAALLLAADASGERQWRDAAVDIALVAAARDPEQSGIVDAGVCHGAAGLAHIFNRIHQVTGVERLADAARGWYGRALDLFDEGTGIGGFQSWQREDFDHPFRWTDDPGLLTGAAGIALALDAAAEPVEPAWDAIFLLSQVGA